jgi:regulator of protease activity HflC (stomatin/prohibitin superfamily)
MAGIAIAVALVLIFAAVRAIRVVPNGSAYVVERLGRYRATLPAGFHVIAPIVDRVAFKHSTAPQTIELTDVCETKDHLRATLTAVLRFVVLDAQKASYASADYLDFLRALVRTSQKRYVETQTWESLREDRRSLQLEVMRGVEAAAETVGVKVLGYELRKLDLAT